MNQSHPDEILEFQKIYSALRYEIKKVFIGHDQLIKELLSAVFADGHILLEGVPGLGKTLLADSLAKCVNSKFSRIQFTPDLMPADITGTMMLQEDERGAHCFQFKPGPIYANFVLADEINRATPKTQSALLEAMQEHQVSTGNKTIKLPEPFTVIATQNPIEHEGTYPLPEAELDRFMIKVNLEYPQEEDYHQILNITTGTEQKTIEAVCLAEDIICLRKIVREVIVSSQVQTYAVRLTMGSQPGSKYAPPEVNNWLTLGAGPRAAQALIMMGKVYALTDGRVSVSCNDLREVAPAVMRHRLMLNFEARNHGKTADDIIAKIIKNTQELS